MNKEADVVIVGGGVTGLGLAYRLIERGMKDVVVLEKGYLGAGASGRFPGVAVQQWASMEETALARDGVKELERLSGELKFNIMFRQDGGLILALTEEQVERLRVSVRFQNLLKVKSKLINPREAGKIVPMLRTDKILGAAFCPTDGVVYPYALLWGYAQTVRRGGGEIRTFTEAKGIKVEGGEVRAVVTDKGEIKTSAVVNAAGARSTEVAKMAGVAPLTEPHRREFVITEPLKPFLHPFVLSPRNALCMAQTMRGEVICSITAPRGPDPQSMRSSAESLHKIARAVVELMPQFTHLDVMRQWVGLYDVAPDGMPVLGGAKEVRGFIHASGFGNHGLEFPTAAAKLLAELIVEGKTSRMLEAFSPDRFAERKPKETRAITRR